MGLWTLPLPGGMEVFLLMHLSLSKIGIEGNGFSHNALSLTLVGNKPDSFLEKVAFYFSVASFFFFWLRWVFVAEHGLSLVAASGGYSSLWCMGFSLRWLLLLRSMGSRRAGFSSCGLWALEHRLSSCGTRA